MKITLTGSLGNISKPLTRELIEKGHSFTVISRKTEKQKDIEALGAMAAIGSIEDVRRQDHELVQGGNCDYE
jgi:NAD dependent epimerase/dehydratase family enzyme